MRGESGRNEFLRGPFALFEAHSRAKFVRNLIKHGWASMSPPELIPPPSPGQVSAGDGRLRRRFLRHRTWSVPGAPAGRYQNLPQFFKKSIDGISYFPHTVALSGRTGGVLTCLTKSPFIALLTK